MGPADQTAQAAFATPGLRRDSDTGRPGTVTFLETFLEQAVKGSETIKHERGTGLRVGCVMPSSLLRPCRLAFLLAMTTLVLGRSITRAADPQPYVVTIDKTGNAALDQALVASATLIRLL